MASLCQDTGIGSNLSNTGRFLPNIDKDHSTCVHFQGLICDVNNPYELWSKWGRDQWDKFGKFEKRQKSGNVKRKSLG